MEEQKRGNGGTKKGQWRNKKGAMEEQREQRRRMIKTDRKFLSKAIPFRYKIHV
jgi:hypothetical protein